jgi:putative DNA primase/helicase
LTHGRWRSNEGKIYPKPLADYIEEKLEIITVRDTREVFVYSDGFYHEKGDTYIEEVVNWILGNSVKKHHRNEVIDAIKTESYVSRRKLNRPLKYLNLNNGLFNLETFELDGHTSEYYFTRQSPINFNPEAECPKFKEFLDDIVREADKKVVQEMFGYALMNKQPYQKAFMLVGEGSNGKSTLTEILENLIGSESISNVELQDLQKNRFAAAELFGKKANIASDISGSAMKETSQFKTLTGGDTTMAEKKHKDPFQFRNQATLIFAANEVPQSYDKTEAFFRRWRIIEFPYKFTDNPDDDHKQKDSKLLEKILTQEELEGVLKWALEGAKRLKDQGEFSNSGSIEDTKEDYLMRSETVYAFCKTHLSQGEMSKKEDTDFVLKDEAYDKYREFCEDNDFDARAKNSFCQKVKKYMNVRDYRPTVEGKQIGAWRGIKMDGESAEEWPSW